MASIAWNAQQVADALERPLLRIVILKLKRHVLTQLIWRRRCWCLPCQILGIHWDQYKVAGTQVGMQHRKIIITAICINQVLGMISTPCTEPDLLEWGCALCWLIYILVTFWGLVWSSTLSVHFWKWFVSLSLFLIAFDADGSWYVWVQWLHAAEDISNRWQLGGVAPKTAELCEPRDLALAPMFLRLDCFDLF